MQMQIGKVNGKMPETGYEFSKNGLFQREAEGLTLKSIIEEIKSPSKLQDILTTRINSSQVS